MCGFFLELLKQPARLQMQIDYLSPIEISSQSIVHGIDAVWQPVRLSGDSKFGKC